MTSTDPVVAITEADARGEIDQLYADIRACLGVPVVNLIWRHLATIPNALPWTWGSVKPLFASNAIAAHAQALHRELRVPGTATMGRAHLRTAGLDANDRQRINQVVSSYERSNAMNVIALCTVLARLDGAPRDAGALTPPGRDSDVPEAPEQDAIGGEMPVLLPLEAMEVDTRARVNALNALGGRDAILPSMYRHLAHWPAYLELLEQIIAPVVARGELEPLINAVIDAGHRRGARLAGNLVEPSAPIAPQHRDTVRTVLTQFIEGPLGKMTAIVALVRHALPESEMRG